MNAKLEIQNLKCHGCAHTISSRIKNIDGIDEIIVNNDNNTVAFTYASNQDLEEAKTLLSKLGYPIVGDNNPLAKKAKSFVSCAVGRINK